MDSAATAKSGQGGSEAGLGSGGRLAHGKKLDFQLGLPVPQPAQVLFLLLPCLYYHK